MGIASIRRAVWAFPLVLACGGGSGAPPSTPPATTASPAGSAGEAAPPPSGKWSDMNRDQRMTYMKKVVLPKMKETFTAFDPKQFDHVTCLTCHGAGAKDGSFKMPNPELPKLSPDGGFKKHLDQKPEITKFMMSKVLPQMAELLNTQPYDPNTHLGFGCFGCHAIAK
ncbi:MAG TPA: hypothetical protein VK550_11110 [Polyangiaceae bacterium]|nr:hypothetical protein [Polyangiaceae bacterium]